MTVRRSSFFLVLGAAIAVAWIGASIGVGGQTTGQATLTVLSREGRRALTLTTQNDQEFVFLDDLSTLLQLTVSEESPGPLTVGYKGKTILLTPDQPLVSISGRLVSLPARPARLGRRWMVPVDFISRALGLIYDSRLDLRKNAHLLVVGDLRVPRVTVRVEGADGSRVVIDATPRTTSAVSQSGNSLLVNFDADALDISVPSFQPQALTRAVRLIEPATAAIDLGPRFAAFRAGSETVDAATRVTIDLQSTPTDTQAPSPPPPAHENADAFPASPFPPSVRTIAIDPGHGGDDDGVKGQGGNKEKDLTLAVARRVRAIFESRLGLRVVLTRDDDRNLPLDGRTAFANNSQAELLISLHANGSFNKATLGASIFYASFDRDAAPAGPGLVRLPALGGGLRELDLVRWEDAQRRHLARSADLARFLEAEFREHVPLNSHAVETAPLAILESANMPAVLVEMGYLTNHDQETAMAGNDFQNAMAQAIFDAAVKFRDSSGSGAAR